jgi:hypothetical protein
VVAVVVVVVVVLEGIRGGNRGVVCVSQGFCSNLGSLE